MLPDVTWTLTDPLPWETATQGHHGRPVRDAHRPGGPVGWGWPSLWRHCLPNVRGVCPGIPALPPSSLGEILGDVLVLFPLRLCRGPLGSAPRASAWPKLHLPSVSSNCRVAGSFTVNRYSLSLGGKATGCSARGWGSDSPRGPHSPRPPARRAGLAPIPLATLSGSFTQKSER